MRTLLQALVILLLVSQVPAGSSERAVPDPALELTATPPRGKAPLTVVLRGILENVDHEDPTYYCLDAEWDFDPDHSLDTNDGPPFESGQQKVQLHTFEKPGTYRVRLMLRHGNEILLRDETWVKVFSSAPVAGDRWDAPERAEVSDLLRTPGTYDRRTVIVRGRLEMFSTSLSGDPRSRSQYVLADRKTQDDLPFRMKKTPRDFVIKVADAAIWVTGRLPHGEGFQLDASRFRDTGKWLEVIGIPWTESNTVYLRAEKLSIAAQPENLDLETRAPERPVVTPPPPEILFTLPLNGERGIPLDTGFRIQFSEDMDPESFVENIVLLYPSKGFLPPHFQFAYDSASLTLDSECKPRA